VNSSSVVSGIVRFGSREGSLDASMGQIGLEAESAEMILEETAKNFTDAVIAQSELGLLLFIALFTS